MEKSYIIIFLMLLSVYGNAQKSYSWKDVFGKKKVADTTSEYFKEITPKQATITIGVVSNIYQGGVYGLYNIGVSLTSISRRGLGMYFEGKWGTFTRYNIGFAVRISNPIKAYIAIGAVSYSPTPCYYTNYAGGILLVLPIRLGFQAGVDYSNGRINMPYKNNLGINIGINYTL